ncbi:hypothetical protein [Microbacterium sp. NPDC056736]|uniref:hypothetical protein n=1 Tax=Microbacterium sp. NPDC056736 TaxID=3345932 RepID=UPI00366BBA86
MSPDIVREDSDAGVTMIELIIYVVVVSLLLIAVATMLLNSWRTQEDVLTASQATNRGQLVSSTIERAVRNALALRVVGTTLTVHTSLGAGQTCQGFDLAGEAKMAMSAGALPAEWPSWDIDIASIPGEVILEETETGKTVDYAFEIATATAPVRFVGTASARNATGVSSPCW